MSRFSEMGRRLHQGEIAFDFVGRRRLWYRISVLILLAALAGLGVRGLHLGIEFQGGTVYTLAKPGLTVSQAQGAVDGIAGGAGPLVQSTGDGRIRIQMSSAEEVPAAEFTGALSSRLDVPKDSIDVQMIGPSWGKQISERALLGLFAFLALVTVYLAVAFEWRMAAAALAALLHDVFITVGLYALVGFEVTPGTVIGFLTILGYSLYDTVVVFDGVKDKAKGITRQTRMTFGEAANQALNQTLVRSLNTTVVALLPVAALLFVGGGLLGAGSLNDISLALFLGLATGAYSSICVATPLLAQLKERQPEMKQLASRVAKQRARAEAAAAPALAG
ncbi:protein translocase subunit SecF [Kitasatospora sp. NPDC086791]|uniref:protein translocase subunit SecF n=1 Tax=Kitasatospora sp. NPDC086791 TaxID=3155178 RepID=UPI00341F800C